MQCRTTRLNRTLGWETDEGSAEEDSAKNRRGSTQGRRTWLLGPRIAAVGLLALGGAGSVAAQPVTITCTSEADGSGRQHCPANTASGVLLIKSTGPTGCLLGKTWGYDDQGIWVTDGCSGDFQAGATSAGMATVDSVRQATDAAGSEAADTPAEADASVQTQADEDAETWGFLDPGKGFLLGKSKAGEVSLSAYALLRYMNQTGDDTFTDHLGNVRPVDLRHDIYSHRILVFLKGWIGVPKLVYNIAFWTVNTTDQDALFGNLGYRFHRKFNLYGGIAGNPGSRSLQGSHPYWLGNDRVMADEFFRPFFTQGVWANGEVAPGLWYNVMVGNSSSILGVTATELDRQFTTGGSMWWMPTTHEFGPRGAYGDWEYHDKVATRFGFSSTFSPEQRYTAVGSNPGNTALKLADSVNLFSTGALAPGVTVTFADYSILALDAGLKYRGFFFQTEFFMRRLDGFQADGLLPVNEIEDQGFYVQTAFYPWPKKLELYAATSQIYGDKKAGFKNSSEYLIGSNYYITDSRNHRVNLQLQRVNHSPVGSTFGYYTAGQNGTTVSTAATIFF